MLDSGRPIIENQGAAHLEETLLRSPMFCSLDSNSLKKNHESIASARSIRGFFTRPRATLCNPAVQYAYQSPKALTKLLFGSHLVAYVVFLSLNCSGSSTFAQTKGDIASHFEFLDKRETPAQQDHALGTAQETKPWTAAERDLVLRLLGEVRKSAPGVYARATAYGRIRLVRVVRRDSEFVGDTLAFANFLTLEVSFADVYFELETDERFHTLTHELIHVIDGGRIGRLSFSPEWLKIMRPAFKDVNAYLTKLRFKSGEDALRQGAPIFVNRFGFPFLYTCSNPQEALADFGAFLVNDPGPDKFNPPAGVREFIHTNLLSSDFTPDSSLKPYLAGVDYLKKSAFTDAEESFTLAISRNPKFDEAFLFRGVARATLEKLDEAILDFNQCEALWTEKDELVGALSYDDYKTRAERIEYLFRRGIVWDRKKDYAKAIADFSSIIDRSPKDLRALLSRAEARSEVRDSKGAVADYSAYLQIENDIKKRAKALARRALIYKTQGNYTAAIADLENVLKLDEWNFDANLKLAMYYRENKQVDEALVEVERVISLRPEFGYSFYLRGALQLAKGDHQKSAKDFEHALVLDPTLKDLIEKTAQKKKGNP